MRRTDHSPSLLILQVLMLLVLAIQEPLVAALLALPSLFVVWSDHRLRGLSR